MVSARAATGISAPAAVPVIDNSAYPYVAVKLGCGVVALCRPEVFVRCPQFLKILDLDLRQCLSILPRSVRPLIRRTKVWVNAGYSYGPLREPIMLSHTAVHHNHVWLVTCAADRPDKALGVEIYDCFDYERMRLHWNGCGLIMHELCHLIHQQVLTGGLENASVVEAFNKARASGLYDQVVRRDWPGKDEYDCAYAMYNHKEFFSEMSVTYWSNSRSYTALDGADKRCLAKCSPPLIEPITLAKLKETNPPATTAKIPALSSKPQRHHQRTQRPDPTKVLSDCPAYQFLSSTTTTRPSPQPHRNHKLPHCNKFYPFTRGQMRNHDPELYNFYDNLWKDIARWKDPLHRERASCDRLLGCLLPSPWNNRKTAAMIKPAPDTVEL